MTLKLPTDIQTFVDQQVKSGEFASANDVVCAGLRLLKTQCGANPEDDFRQGEWDKLLAEGETAGTMTLDEAIAKRRAERARGGPAQ